MTPETTPAAARPLLAICTHHKTGTVWMGGIFRPLAREFGLVFTKERQAALPARWDVWLDHHSRADLAALRETARAARRPLRLLHVIRDPRDVVISGAHYHVRTDEVWANRQRGRYGGRSYREAIGALATEHERMVFEMDEVGGKTIRDMVAWRYGEPEVHEARYEDLIVDAELLRFTRILRFLGFEGAALQRGLEIVQQKSLFGGLEAHHHVRSGRPAQWRSRFTPELAAAFAQRFPDAVRRLGYDAEADLPAAA